MYKVKNLGVTATGARTVGGMRKDQTVRSPVKLSVKKLFYVSVGSSVPVLHTSFS
jgi:hypothetical protein